VPFEGFEAAVVELVSLPWLVMSKSEDGQICQYGRQLWANIVLKVMGSERIFKFSDLYIELRLTKETQSIF
jgi:hypothetical protein